MIQPATPFLLAGLAALALSACAADDATRKFGTTRDGPDEVRVTSRPPLSVPPLLAQRPPRAGAPRADEAAPADLTAENGREPVSPGQGALLDAAGPSAPPNIRQRVDQDAQLRRQDQGFTDELLFSPPGAGQSVGGEAPIIQQGGKSWLGGLF
jgi:Protein of unknown function (DUF3035)